MKFPFLTLLTMLSGFAFAQASSLTGSETANNTSPQRTCATHEKHIEMMGLQKYADAQQRIVYLRELLARHELHVADYYLRRGAFLAAVERGRWVIENYPESSATRDALATMVEGYQGLGMDDRAREVLTVLRENAPDHEQLQNGRFTPKHGNSD